MLGGNPALESNLQLVYLPSETAQLRRPEKDLEGLSDLGSLVWQEETEHHVVWSTHVDARTRVVCIASGLCLETFMEILLLEIWSYKQQDITVTAVGPLKLCFMDK